MWPDKHHERDGFAISSAAFRPPGLNQASNVNFSAHLSLVMDPLSALAIAAAVVQFADVGLRILSGVTKRKNGGIFSSSNTSDDRPDLCLAELDSAMQRIQESAEYLGPEVGRASRTQFVDIRNRCDAIASRLRDPLMAEKRQHEYRKGGAGEGSSIWSSFSPFLKWPSAQVDDVNAKLGELRILSMQSVLLCIWYEEEFEDTITIEVSR